MNFRLIIKLLGAVCIAIGVAMAFSIPWAWIGDAKDYNRNGVWGLLISMSICFVVGFLFYGIAHNAKMTLFRREAIAVVAFSWIFAAILGAFPYYLSGTQRAVVVNEQGEKVFVLMSFADSLFESASGFTTTGATVLKDVEKVSRCLLFWRCSTHFLGGIGIIVLLVAILGQGLGGKAVLRAERSGAPSEGTPHARVQSLAWSLVGIYLGLNAVLAILLTALKLSPFDAVCHAFSAMATGGFSTKNASVGYFIADPQYNGAAIEWVLTFFMFLGGTNFLLFYWCLRGEPQRLFRDTEWRTYLGFLVAASALVFFFNVRNCDFDQFGTSDKPILFQSPQTSDASNPSVELRNPPTSYAVRTSVFQVVSLMTSTGFVTDEYEKWNAASVAILLTLMITGACAGSTAGGLKIFRVILCLKMFRGQIEQTYHPTVVRKVWWQKSVVPQELLHQTAVHIGLYFFLIILFSLIIAAIESDSAWIAGNFPVTRKLYDVISMVLACVGNIGPGVGMIGARGNFGGLSEITKFLLTCAMFLGRLEFFAVFSLFSLRFWKPQA
ncbi:MAG: TrkH family potassium uptake protein [Planctomycetaceae bacterium]|jgi:trk system potassium uptake protein TrkH|nr:TrkH family potassium uptake protein [Planctomycetaceae bacterium]